MGIAPDGLNDSGPMQDQLPLPIQPNQELRATSVPPHLHSKRRPRTSLRGYLHEGPKAAKKLRDDARFPSLLRRMNLSLSPRDTDRSVNELYDPTCTKSPPPTNGGKEEESSQEQQVPSDVVECAAIGVEQLVVCDKQQHHDDIQQHNDCAAAECQPEVNHEPTRVTRVLKRENCDQKWGIGFNVDSCGAIHVRLAPMQGTPSWSLLHEHVNDRIYMVNGQTTTEEIREELCTSLSIVIGFEKMPDMCAIAPKSSCEAQLLGGHDREQWESTAAAACSSIPDSQCAAAEDKQVRQEYRQALHDGALEELAGSLLRCAVGRSDFPLRSYINHEDYGQRYWDKGHPMNHGDFQHDFGFWAFAQSHPGTKQVVIGIAGGNATLGPSRCIVKGISGQDASEPREVCLEMTANAIVPALSFWAYSSPRVGTVRIAVLEATNALAAHSLLVRVPTLQDGSLAPVPSCPGFVHVLDFWAYPDPGPRTKGSSAVCDAPRFSRHQGFISSGGDIGAGWFTLDEAEAWSVALPGCRGFTYSEDAEYECDGKYFVFFKNHWDVSGSGWISHRLHRSGEFDPAEVAVNDIPKEYIAVRQTLCIRSDILLQCEVLRKAEVLQRDYGDAGYDIETLLLAAGRKAFPQEAVKACLEGRDIIIELLHDEASPQVGLVSQLSKLATADATFLLQAWRSTLLLPLLRYIVEAADPGDAAASLLMLGHCSWRLFDGVICPAIARRSFDKCLRFSRVDAPTLTTLGLPPSGPCMEFRQWAFEYLEVHKEKALASAFLEPCKLYWRRLGGPLCLHEAHVDAHAANAFAGLVEHTLGVSCPMPVSWDDFFAVYGIVEFVRADFMQGALRAMERLDNFGQHFSKISRERGEEDAATEAVEMGGVQFIFPGARSPAAMVERAFWAAEEGQPEREALVPYLERFARFFSEDFFLEAACSAALVDDLGGGAQKLANALRELCSEEMNPLAERVQRKLVVSEDQSDMAAQVAAVADQDDLGLCRALLWDFDEYLFPCFDVEAARHLFGFVGGILRD